MTHSDDARVPVSHLNPPRGGRRSFLSRLAVATVAMPTLGACDRFLSPEEAGEPAPARPPAPTPVETNDEAHDAEILATGIGLEHGAVEVYRAAVGLPFIKSDKALLEVASLFMGQHEEHRERLRAAIERLGGKVPELGSDKVPPIPEAVLDQSASADARKLATLQFARSLERKAADAYFALVTKNLRTEFARQAAAEILPVEAQHVAIYDFVLKDQRLVNAPFFSEQS